MADTSPFKSFREFYPFYLSQHAHLTCRRLHFVGTTLLLGVVAYSAMTGKAQFLFLIPVIGYGFAWIGHFFFEKNRPATFKHPLYSLMGDFKMYWDILRGRVAIVNRTNSS